MKFLPVQMRSRIFDKFNNAKDNLRMSDRPGTLVPRADGGEDQSASGFSLHLIRCGKSLNFLQMLRVVGGTA